MPYRSSLFSTPYGGYGSYGGYNTYGGLGNYSTFGMRDNTEERYSIRNFSQYVFYF